MKTTSAVLQAPHRPIPVRDEKEKLALNLFDALWVRYRRRVAHVRAYEQVIRRHGATFVNDHIAFRTLALQKPMTGIFTLSRIFMSLGWSPAACHEFPDKHMSSIHLEHANTLFPKLFVTELKTWELPDAARKIIRQAIKSHGPQFSDNDLTDLRNANQIRPARRRALLKSLIRFFTALPWKIPRREWVAAIDRETQFGAWVLLNGYEVNHFTASVNSHGVASLDDIDKTVAAMKKAGVPMKKEIEGAPGSVLRQTSTESVVLPFRVRGKRGPEKLDWTCAYFEIAERGYWVDPLSGLRRRFEGFLGAQATHLFDMTRLQK